MCILIKPSHSSPLLMRLAGSLVVSLLFGCASPSTFTQSKSGQFVAHATANASIVVAAEDAKNPEKTRYFAIKKYTYLLNALDDFIINNQAGVHYYADPKNACVAIDASIKTNRNTYAEASHTYKEKNGTYDLTLVTLTEDDGESNYQVKLNNTVIGQFKNPENPKNNIEVYFVIENVKLAAGDIITIGSTAVTNGKVPENDETAYARGRWRGLVLQHQ